MHARAAGGLLLVVLLAGNACIHAVQAGQRGPARHSKTAADAGSQPAAAASAALKPTDEAGVGIAALPSGSVVVSTASWIQPRGDGSDYGDSSDAGEASGKPRFFDGSLFAKERPPSTGFTGGERPPVWPPCLDDQLPGCEVCPDNQRGCQSCYSELDGARFVLNPDTHRCMCPAGFGLWSPELVDELQASPFIDDSSGFMGWSRRLTEVQAAAPAMGKPGSSAAVGSFNHSAAVATASSWRQLRAPPRWASACLPCPMNWFSPGGDIGYAQCQQCPAGWSTGGSTASANCLAPYCPAGQQPTSFTQGDCVACPYGTWNPSDANNGPCHTCPTNTTTAVTGATSLADCKVPICAAGQQLDTDLFVCTNCTGNTVSLPGVRGNGPFQPRCLECPNGSAASINRTRCLRDVCPPPDAFRIECQTDHLPNCGPGDPSIDLGRLCKAFPRGAQLSWARGVVVERLDTASGRDALFTLPSAATPAAFEVSRLVNPAIAQCPAAANGSNVYFPYISSFNGLTNCLCSDTTSCWFATGITQLLGRSNNFARNPFNPESFLVTPSIALRDPQQDSLQALVRALAPGKAGDYPNLLAGYCKEVNDDEFTGAQQRELKVSCSPGYPYAITNVTLTDFSSSSPPGGSLPNAAELPGLSYLRWLACTNCSLSGVLPQDWGWSPNLMGLQYLRLDGTQRLDAPLPSTWGNMVNLRELRLASRANASSLTIPSAWGGMRSLGLADLARWWFLGCSSPSDGSSSPNCTGVPACAPWRWANVNGLQSGSTLQLPTGMGPCPFDGFARVP